MNREVTSGMTASRLRPFLLAYGSLVFAPAPLPSVLVLLASFCHPYVGLLGLAGGIVAYLGAKWVGGNREVLRTGIYNISGILVGLALGMYGEPSLRIWVFLFIGAILSGFVSVLVGNRFSRYDLPILSLPFMLVIWPILITYQQGSAVGFGTFLPFLSIDTFLFRNLGTPFYAGIRMFGSILFQDNGLSSILILLAIGIYSRVTLLYGLWGGLLALPVYAYITGSLDGFHGLNYVLTAMALGGFFLVTNRSAFTLVTISILAVGIVDTSASALLRGMEAGGHFLLPTLALAFNTITLLILLPIKSSSLPIASLRLVPVPLATIRSPELNRHWYELALKSASQKTMITLPIIGKWNILQGHNGEWTHKVQGRFAWDFVIFDEAGRQHRGVGLKSDDYYAFGLPVLAPAGGVVVEALNDVPDNPPREAVTELNWGNYIVIDHLNGEFSRLAHFRMGSIRPELGARVKRGEVVGSCGNSGRSGVPHLHYQLEKRVGNGFESIDAVFCEGTVDCVPSVNINPKAGNSVSAIDMDAEAEWSLLGKEGEVWTIECAAGSKHTQEQVTFTTDSFGNPILSSGDNTWYIFDRPTFAELLPDYKTVPSLFNSSLLVKLIGKSLILPKRLSDGWTWSGGDCRSTGRGRWEIRTEGCKVLISQANGAIESIRDR